MITKQAIITAVLNRTARRASELTDSEINASLLALSLDVEGLSKECKTTTSTGRAYYDLTALPKRVRNLKAITIETGNVSDNTFLKKFKDFEQYRGLIVSETTADQDIPTSWIIDGDYLYLYPTPDGNYTLTLNYSGLEFNADSIELDDIYFEAIVARTCYELYTNKGLTGTEQAQTQLSKYQDWVRKLNKLEIMQNRPSFVGYTDI